MTTLNGKMLEGIEKDLLRIGRELAANHALLTAAKFIALGGSEADPDGEWFHAAEHIAPIEDASEALTIARKAVLQTVREVQATNPIPARFCGNYQHEGTPSENDRPCSECGGSGYVAGIEERHLHDYRFEPNLDIARLDLLNHWEGDHMKDADSYEEAGGNATRLTWEELIELHRENH